MQYTMKNILYADCEDILYSVVISVPYRDASCQKYGFLQQMEKTSCGLNLYTFNLQLHDFKY